MPLLSATPAIARVFISLYVPSPLLMPVSSFVQTLFFRAVPKPSIGAPFTSSLCARLLVTAWCIIVLVATFPTLYHHCNLWNWTFASFDEHGTHCCSILLQGLPARYWGIVSFFSIVNYHSRVIYVYTLRCTPSSRVYRPAMGEVSNPTALLFPVFYRSEAKTSPEVPA